MLPTMTTPEIEKLIKKTARHGAVAARVCGAGGGGCVALFAEPTKRDELAECVREMNMQIIPTRISEMGVIVEDTDGQQ